MGQTKFTKELKKWVEGDQLEPVEEAKFRKGEYSGEDFEELGGIPMILSL